jgi:hypothetical protein
LVHFVEVEHVVDDIDAVHMVAAFVVALVICEKSVLVVAVAALEPREEGLALLIALEMRQLMLRT